MAFESLGSPSGSLRKNLSQAERLRGVWSLRGFMQEPNGYGAWLLSADEGDDDDGDDDDDDESNDWRIPR